jgi:hypothetical protein
VPERILLSFIFIIFILVSREDFIDVFEILYARSWYIDKK